MRLRLLAAPALFVLLLAQHRAPFRPPGVCAHVATRNWLLHRHVTQSSPPDPSYPYSHDDTVTMDTGRPFDLDGDGMNDIVVPEPEPEDCVQDFHFSLFVVRGSCGHLVGVVHGMVDPASLATAPRYGGLPELVTHTERQSQPDPRAPAQLVRTTHTYRFDGTAYREVSHTSQTDVCHHCPSQSCEHSLR